MTLRESLRRRRLRFEANAFEVFVAVAGLNAAVAFFAAPAALDSSPIGRALRPWDVVWNGLLAVGALLILVGLWRGRVNVEAAGLVTLSAAIVILCVAIAATVGAQGAVSIAIDSACVLTCGARLRSLTRRNGADEDGEL